MRRLVPAVVLLLLALPSAAQASRHQLRIFQDDRMLVYSGPVVRALVLDQAKAMGVDAIRVQFVWRNIALSKPANPADPNAYGTAWSNWDSLVLDARKRHLKVLATVTGPAPTWAAGTTAGYYTGSRYPNAKAFAQFMTAVGRRYSGHANAAAATKSAGLLDPCTPVPPLITCGPSGPVITPPAPAPAPGGGSPPPQSPPPSGGGGTDQSPPPPPGSGTPTPPQPPGTRLPRISLWSIYNEPNHPLFLWPQRRKGILTSPSLYRALYRAGWKALARTGHRRDAILMGEVLPIGSNANRETATTSPLRFARELFCLNGSGRRHPGCRGRFAPLHASGWAIHAYYRKTGPFSRPPGRDDVTPATIGRMHALLAHARGRGRLRGSAALWDTEDGSQTRPPDPKGTSPKRQARFINEAEYLAWRTPFMHSYSQYLWTDEQPVWAFQSGLFFANGKPKPALASYRLPIYVKRAGGGVIVWGHVPRPGVVTIMRSRGRAVRVHARDYFTKRLAGQARTYRLRFGNWASRRASPT